MALRTTLRTLWSWVQSDATEATRTAASKFADLDVLWPSGTGSSQADRVLATYSNAIAGGATETIDLASFVDALAATGQSMAEVRAIRFRPSTTAMSLAPGASNGWTGLGADFKVTLPIGTLFELVNATDGRLPITGSSKTIAITNTSGGTAGSYDLEIIGVSA